MDHHEDAASDAGSICSSECPPPGLVPDLSNMTGVNLDGCTDTHVGPRINFNIVLSGNEDDNKRALRPINRIFDEKILSSPNVFQKPTLGNEEKWGAEPSAPYESDESVASTFQDQEPPNGGNPKQLWWKRRRTCVLATCVAVLLVGGGLTGGLYYASVKSVDGSGSTTSSSSPPTPTPPGSTPAPANPTTLTTVSVGTSPTSTNSTPTPSPATPIPSCQEYENWGQVRPPDKYWRSEEDQFTTVALDNLPGARCVEKESCVALLKKKAESGESLNYNFLIDDSGNLYYARGRRWMANGNTNIARVAFIGSYDGSDHLTDDQIQMLSLMVVDNPQKFTIGDAYLEAQCIQNVEGETGPDINVICDVEAKLRTKLKHPTVITVPTIKIGTDKCPWGPKRLDCPS